MKKHFYIEYNKYGMISCNSFDGPEKNGHAFLQFATLEQLNEFLEKNAFSGCNLVARRCKYADVVKNVGKNFRIAYVDKNFRILCGVCVRANAWGGVDLQDSYNAQVVSTALDLKNKEAKN